MEDEKSNASLDSQEIVLTEVQKLEILKFWNSKPENPPSLQEIVGLIFPGKESRDKWGRAVRQFLATRKMKPLLAQDWVKKRVELTEEQQEVVIKNASSKKPYEIGKEIFGPNIEPASAEVKAIVAFLATIPNSPIFHARALQDCTDEYIPPKSLTALIPKVNEYANPEKRLDTKALTAKQKRELMALIGYLHTKRFLFHIKTYEKQEDRILFESQFIKCTYDKGDLTQEDVDQYIMWAIDVVNSHTISRTISMMQKEQDTLVENGEKMSMTLVEAISIARNEFEKSSKRQSELLKALTQKRSDRMSKLVKENATILNLVSFVKEEENRRKLIEYNQLKANKLKDEIHKYIDMSELKIRILGIGEEEVLNG